MRCLLAGVLQPLLHTSCGGGAAAEGQTGASGSGGACSACAGTGGGGASAAGAAGAGGGPGGGGASGSAGAAGVGCVDIVVNDLHFADLDAWYPSPGGALSQPNVFRAPEGVVVVWIASSKAPSPNPNQVGHPWFIATTYDPDTGEPKADARFDLLEPGEKVSYSAAAVSPEGLIAIAIQRTTAKIVGPVQVYVSDLGNPSVGVMVDIPTDDDKVVRHVTWDGEAFAINLQAGPSGALYVARVDPKGKVLLPKTKYGTGSIGWLIQAATDPVTGNTFVADGFGPLWVTGHDRSGQVLWTPSPTKLYEEGTAYPAVSADPGGAWVVSYRSVVTQETLVRRIGLDGKVAEPSPSWTLLPPKDDKGGVARRYTVASLPGGGAWFTTYTGPWMYSYTTDGSSIAGPTPVLDGAPADKFLELDGFAAVAAGGERWVTFTEQRPVSGKPLATRVLKVVDGCVYKRLDALGAP